MGNSSAYKWSFFDRGGLAVINFTVNLVLARMLTKADFGLLAMIAIFTGIAQNLSSCGLSDGLIHKTDPSEDDYSTVFMFNAGVGLLMGLIFFFTAPLIAAYFGHDELIVIMRTLGVCFFFQTMSYVQETRLRKEMQFRKICLVHIGATVTVSVLGIVAASRGMGYKALICTQIMLGFFQFVYYLIASGWFPRLVFRLKAFKEFFSYGVHLMISYIATMIGSNINTFVLGRFYSSPSQSGVYYQGAKFANVPFSVSELSLNIPFFVVASNETDAARRRQLFSDMFGTIVAVNSCILMLMLVVAGPVIDLLYGAKWHESIPVFRILALAEFLLCVKAFYQTVCKVYGRTRFVRDMGFAATAIQLLLLWIFYRYGILVIAWTQVAGVAIVVIIYTFYCHGVSMMSIRLRSLAAIAVRSCWLSVVSGLVSLAVLMAVSSLPVFVVCVLVSLAYCATLVLLGEWLRPTVYMQLRDRIIRKHREGRNSK